MPENNPIKKEDPNVEIDTSGPEVDVALPEEKVEDVAEQVTEAPKQEEVKQEEVKEEPKKSDQELEDYSKGVQARIAKLTRKMREAERREQAATEYAKAVEQKRQALEKRFEKTDSDYIKKFESSIATGMEAAQKELAAAIESGDAQAQVEANKRIATLAFENAKLATSDNRKNTEKCIKILGIGTYLDMVVCGDDGFKTKPAPDTVQHICSELGVSPYETFMVGDTQADIDAGLRAKCGGIFLVREDQNFHKFKNYHVHIRDVNQLNYYLD